MEGSLQTVPAFGLFCDRLDVFLKDNLLLRGGTDQCAEPAQVEMGTQARSGVVDARQVAHVSPTSHGNRDLDAT